MIGALRSGHWKVDPRRSIDMFHRLCKEGLLSQWDCEKHQDPTPGLPTPAILPVTHQTRTHEGKHFLIWILSHFSLLLTCQPHYI